MQLASGESKGAFHRFKTPGPMSIGIGPKGAIRAHDFLSGGIVIDDIHQNL